MSRAFVDHWRIQFIAIGILLSFGAVLARLYFLHVVDHERLSEFANVSRKMVISLEARRGDILDARGNLLATTRPRVNLGVDPQAIEAISDEQIGKLADLLGLSESVIREKIERKTRMVEIDGKSVERMVRWVKLAEIDPDLYESIQALEIKGVYGNLRFERYYPTGSKAAHVLGYLNKEGVSVTGVERYMDFYLSGQRGWKETEGDVRRREVAQFREREVYPKNGYNVELTIDSVVQNIVEEAIAHLVEKYDPEGVSVIVSNPNTGEIMGLGNYPSFDPNTFWKFPLENQRNRAISDLYEPGSTFKIVPVAAALEEHMVTPDTLIDCTQPVADYHGRKLKLPSDHVTLGMIPVSQVVAKSSNRGAAQLGLKLGENLLYSYCAKFGFGAETNWGMGGEASGILHPTNRWDGLTITRLPAGYAVSATPMQVHLAMSSIANGGHLMRPKVVRRILNEAGEPVIEFLNRERRQVVSEETARLLGAMLVEVVSTQGTARKAIIPGFEVAGKTGTSRKIINGQYSHTDHYASFSGFFPARNPQIAITVMVDNAHLKGVAYGGSVAAPAFREIGEGLIQYFALTPVSDDPDRIYAQLKRESAF